MKANRNMRTHEMKQAAESLLLMLSLHLKNLHSPQLRKPLPLLPQLLLHLLQKLPLRKLPGDSQGCLLVPVVDHLSLPGHLPRRHQQRKKQSQKNLLLQQLQLPHQQHQQQPLLLFLQHALCCLPAQALLPLPSHVVLRLLRHHLPWRSPRRLNVYVVRYKASVPTSFVQLYVFGTLPALPCFNN